ncbi:uncharacterized protein LOC127737408 [Mytilus californianus]|uniref:uncharacterized protein LOC127737408 n=1 Tax=Mytilus californianus TaxID=6549 RepID=UPI0022467D5A|nr:uncharacterized protein LOC127737408 [Mytilus californianus]
MKQDNYVLMSIIVLFCPVLVSTNKGKSIKVENLPEWQQVFINYTTWNGQYIYNKTSYACRMGIHSVNGNVTASLVDSATHIDLTGYSVFGKVIFNKTTTYQSSERFSGSFQLAGHLQWVPSHKYWMYTANVTIPTEKPFSLFKFMSNTEKTTIESESSRTTSIVLGIVFSLAILGVVLMAGSMIWSYRKGLLRHIPLSYRTFKNPKEERRASFDSREETVHI